MNDSVQAIGNNNSNLRFSTSILYSQKKKKIDLRKSNAIDTSKIRKLRKCGKGNLERRKLRGRNNNPFKQDY